MAQNHDKSINDMTYDEFLDQWEETDLLKYVTLEQNLHDPYIESILHNSTGVEDRLIRSRYIKNQYNTTELIEINHRKFSFIESKREDYEQDFIERLQNIGLDQNRIDNFLFAILNDWTDGKNRNLGNMARIQASVQAHDAVYRRPGVEVFVRNSIPDSIEPFFDIHETAAIFDINSNMLTNFFEEYISEVYGEGEGSINRITVRRGIHTPELPGELRYEHNQLSSFSLALTTAEKFSQTYRQIKNGYNCILSTDLPVIQNRVIAFAPFIPKMCIKQMEFVVAPPLEPQKLVYSGKFEDIHEFVFGI